jgi:hypothetical protein
VSDTPPTDREAQLREQANRWSRSETGWERRAGESLSAALLILDAQRDMDAWLAREVLKLRAEVKSLRALLTTAAERVAAQSELLGRRAENAQ